MNEYQDVEVLISLKELTQLQEDSETLRRLHNAGVDNWEWYEDALEDAS